MKYRRLDADGDMLPSRGNPPFEGAAAVCAAVRSRILLFYGEWWETLEEGLDVSSLFGYQSEEKKRVGEALIRERVNETEGVADILSFTVTDSGGHGRKVVDIVIETDTGETAIVTI